MRLLHISDLHIGKHVNEFPMIDDQRYILDTLLDIIRTREVDALLIAGDIYDRSSPSAEAVACVDEFLSAVAQTGASCFAIAGNHDSAERVAYASSLLAKNRIHLSPVYDGTIAHVTMEDEHGSVVFWLIPFLKPAHVRTYFPDDAIDDYTSALECALDACPIDRTQRNVAIAHQFVTFGGSEPERSDSELSLGGMDNVDASVFEAFDYVALGHIHRPQRLARDTMRYSGSPLKYSASEMRYPKSAPLIELGPKGDVSIELVVLEPLHDMRAIKGPIADLTADDTVSSLDPEDREDYIHAVLTDEFPPIDALSKLRAVYPNVMSVSYDNARTSAENEEILGIDADEMSDMNPLELFARFYRDQNGEEMTARQYETALHALEKSEENR
ncbi:MAG: exonuclease SbcCD subunit D [Slackia sp.]|nr:exonuclease SbcCD subunit D [Slackia sp.]